MARLKTIFGPMNGPLVVLLCGLLLANQSPITNALGLGHIINAPLEIAGEVGHLASKPLAALGIAAALPGAQLGSLNPLSLTDGITSGVATGSASVAAGLRDSLGTQPPGGGTASSLLGLGLDANLVGLPGLGGAANLANGLINVAGNTVGSAVNTAASLAGGLGGHLLGHPLGGGLLGNPLGGGLLGGLGGLGGLGAGVGGAAGGAASTSTSTTSTTSTSSGGGVGGIGGIGGGLGGIGAAGGASSSAASSSSASSGGASGLGGGFPVTGGFFPGGYPGGFGGGFQPGLGAGGAASASSAASAAGGVGAGGPMVGNLAGVAAMSGATAGAIGAGIGGGGVLGGFGVPIGVGPALPALPVLAAEGPMIDRAGLSADALASVGAESSIAGEEMMANGIHNAASAALASNAYRQAKLASARDKVNIAGTVQNSARISDAVIATHDAATKAEDSLLGSEIAIDSAGTVLDSDAAYIPPVTNSLLRSLPYGRLSIRNIVPKPLTYPAALLPDVWLNGAPVGYKTVPLGASVYGPGLPGVDYNAFGALGGVGGGIGVGVDIGGSLGVGIGGTPYVPNNGVPLNDMVTDPAFAYYLARPCCWAKLYGWYGRSILPYLANGQLEAMDEVTLANYLAQLQEASAGSTTYTGYGLNNLVPMLTGTVSEANLLPTTTLGTTYPIGSALVIEPRDSFFQDYIDSASSRQNFDERSQ